MPESILSGQTMVRQSGRHLLAHAESKLSPDVFSHPIWVRFGRIEMPASPRMIDRLQSSSITLGEHDPSGACQVLLICAVYLSNAGCFDKALTAIQQAMGLAKRNGLVKEAIWATWGASAICVQQGNSRGAASHLEDLQDILVQQNEWVLADFVEVIKQPLDQFITASKSGENGTLFDELSDDLLAFTIDWLQHWGAPKNGIVSNFDHFSRHLSSNQSIIHSAKSWQIFWSVFLFLVKRFLKPSWAEYNDNSPPNNNPSPVSISTTLPKHETNFDGDIKNNTDSSQFSVTSSHTSNSEIPKATKTSRNRKSGSKNKKGGIKKSIVINVFAQMLGPFNLIIQDSHLKLPHSRGLSIFKYLSLHHKQDTPREVLMDIFWPEATPASARNSLNVTLYGLRQSLHSVTELEVIRFEDGAYGLASEMELWLDVEEFEHCVNQGLRLEEQNQLTKAVTEYEIAVNLYRGDFLADTPYEGWTVFERERLRIAYLDTLDHLSQIYFGQERYAACTNLCQLILNRDLCREDAHCRLMRCYSRLGQGPLALRQYQICVEALKSELEVDPAPEMSQLYEQIRRHEPV